MITAAGGARTLRVEAPPVIRSRGGPLRYDADLIGVLGAAVRAVPVAAWGTTGATFAAQRLGLSAMPTPLVTLDARSVEHNIAAMAAWTSAAGVDLAPHAKTTMAPALWRHQLQAGAIGLTVTTPWQLAVTLDPALSGPVPCVVVAGPLLDPGVLALVGRSPGTRVLCWADGLDVVAAMAERWAGAAAPLEVLVELGAPGGRTGARSVDAALAVAAAVVAAPGLQLAGVAGYEGALAHDGSPASLAVVRAWSLDLRTLHERLLDQRAYPEDLPGGPAGGLLVTAGGSAYFDEVADVLAPLHDPGGARGAPTRVVVRAGAYVAHDDGFYRAISPGSRGAPVALRAALHVWARVISRPEPGLALLDAGKRDVGVDEGLPQVQAVRPGGSGDTEELQGAVVVAVNDQHTHVRLTGAAELVQVGDVLRLGVSHPCTTFDKWQLLPVVDDAGARQPVVVDLLRTVFG